MKYKLFKTKTFKEYDNPLCLGIYVIDLIHGTSTILFKMSEKHHKIRDMIDDYFTMSTASGYKYETKPSVFTYNNYKYKLDPQDENFYFYIGVCDIKTHRE